MAIPPPSGIIFSLCLFAEGLETKPAFREYFLTKAVSSAESTNEPNVKITANLVNVTILTAPVNES